MKTHKPDLGQIASAFASETKAPTPRPVKQPTERTVEKKGSGLIPEGDTRLTANIRKDLHLRLKIAAANQDTTIGEIIENLIEKHVHH